MRCKPVHRRRCDALVAPAARSRPAHALFGRLSLAAQGACRYLEATGDASVLDEVVGYIEGRAVTPEEEGYYDKPTPSRQRGTLYAHYVLALERGCRLLGERGLPPMGSGAWNDGMNRVGDQQRGESVWLGFFLHDTLRRFIGLANAHGDAPRAVWCQRQAERLRQNLEQHAWDGLKSHALELPSWYARDDSLPRGTPRE